MNKKVESSLRKFLVWRSKNLSQRQFVYLLAVSIGVLSGLAAVTIKNSVHLVEMLLTDGVGEEYSYLFFIYPLIGILIVVALVRFVIKSPVGHGVPNALYAISKQNGNIKPKAMWTSVLTASITVGLGGSAGLEGPTVATTSAIGSNVGSWFRQNYKVKVLLIACAASGALSAIFNAPVAAIVFAIEVIMIDLTAASLIPLLLASVSAAIVSMLFLGDNLLFHFTLSEGFTNSDVVPYILLGLATGLISVFFTKVYFGVSELAERMKNIWVRAIIGGSIVGLIIYLFPPIYGEGYAIVNDFIQGSDKLFLDQISFVDNDQIWFASLLLISVIFLKPIATAFTLKSGGIGGIFAPSLFLGAATGFTFARIAGSFGLDLSKSNFTLVGMAGLMAGVLHAPLTAIFLIAEITGGYELFLPLMITSSISFITIKYFSPHSIYTRQLAKRGELLTHHKDQAVLTLMNLKEEIESNFVQVQPYDKLESLVQAIALSPRNLFPVTDQGKFIGVVNLNDVREIMFDTNKYENVLVHELMTAAPEFIYLTDSMEDVMRKFDSSQAWNLPVLESDGQYIGFVSKSKLFSAYRKHLKDFYDEL